VGKRNHNVGSNGPIAPVDNMVGNIFPCANTRSQTGTWEMLLPPSANSIPSTHNDSSMTDFIAFNNPNNDSDSTSSGNDTKGDSDSDSNIANSSDSTDDTSLPETESDKSTVDNSDVDGTMFVANLTLNDVVGYQ